MNTIARMRLAALMVSLPALSLGEVPAAEITSVDFSRDILPILSNKCFVCHGPSTEEPEQLRLDSRKGATADRGGYHAIDPSDPAKSEILKRLNSNSDPMPPEDAARQLTDQERTLLLHWVRNGGEYTKHWAFVPPKKQLGEVNQQTERHDVIDSLILDGLRIAKTTFAPSADRATLARRAALVLTGLPPELEQLDHFLADDQPDAYQQYVDSLLASPRFGEHQARYWLDAVRYGDTHGLHLDNRRGIYPYRDWVVDAFNKNLPLDQFILWQVAGDLLPDPTLAQLVATGFVRMNPTTAEGGAIPAEFQAKNNFDRTETFATVMLGMTFTCARCHTHKYDPITQTEYYQLLAFFNSTAEHSMDKNSYTYAPILKAPKDQNGWAAWYQLEEQQRGIISRAQILLDEGLSISDGFANKWKQSNSAAKLAIAADKAGPFSATALHAEATKLSSQIATAKKNFTTTLVARDLPNRRVTKLLDRGEYNRPIGDPIDPNVPQVMGAFPKNAPSNRLGLAQWLIDSDNPLVARVMVNRIWQRVFGDALVRTPEDFGLQGEHPTHPQLLDWLAVELQQSDWDLKGMIRLMVTSRTFRQSSVWRTDIDDPENRLFARGPTYRLDAEVLRDIGLWSSGLLDPHMGGEGVKPYQPGGMWKALAHPGSNTKQYVKDKGLLLYRRSLYVYWKRTSPHPMMTLFDAPNRESSCVRRSRTNTALQSLGLLNETQRIEMARTLAERLLREANSDAERMALLFRLLASRSPNQQEKTVCSKLLTMMRKRFTEDEEDAKALVSIGDVKRNQELNLVEHAAWTQVAATVLACDPAILLY